MPRPGRDARFRDTWIFFGCGPGCCLGRLHELCAQRDHCAGPGTSHPRAGPGRSELSTPPDVSSANFRASTASVGQRLETPDLLVSATSPIRIRTNLPAGFRYGPAGSQFSSSPCFLTNRYVAQDRRERWRGPPGGSLGVKLSRPSSIKYPKIRARQFLSATFGQTLLLTKPAACNLAE